MRTARDLTAQRWVVLSTIAVGGALGAAGRHGLEQAWSGGVDGFAWTTLGTNVVGCLLIGLLMVHLTEAGSARPLLRPFLGVGVLGGFTTFSTYAVQAATLVRAGDAVLAVAYLLATVLGAVLATALGVRLGRAAVRRGGEHR